MTNSLLPLLPSMVWALNCNTNYTETRHNLNTGRLGWRTPQVTLLHFTKRHKTSQSMTHMCWSSNAKQDIHSTLALARKTENMTPAVSVQVTREDSALSKLTLLAFCRKPTRWQMLSLRLGSQTMQAHLLRLSQLQTPPTALPIGGFKRPPPTSQVSSVSTAHK